jgi:hypothetical protein
MTDRISGSGKGGGKGGSSQTAVQVPDSLRSKAVARVIDVISEGPIKGLVNGAQSIFLDDVPLQNPGGTFNYNNTKIHFRSGLSTQKPISGFSEVESEVAVGQEVKCRTQTVGAIYVYDGGSGYTSAPTVTLVGGLGSAGLGLNENPIPTEQATATAQISGGKVVSVTVTDPGGNYVNPPAVTFSGGGGSGAKANAELAGGIVRIINNNDIDAVRIKARVPTLFLADDKGNVYEAGVNLRIEWKGVGDTRWRSPFYDSMFKKFPAANLTSGFSPACRAVRCNIKFTKAGRSNWEIDFFVRKKGATTWVKYDAYSNFNSSSATTTFYYTFQALDLSAGEYEFLVQDTTWGTPITITDKFYHDDTRRDPDLG